MWLGIGGEKCGGRAENVQAVMIEDAEDLLVAI